MKRLCKWSTPMKQAIEDALQKALDHLQDGQVKEAAAYSLLAGGKRIRPRLFLTALQSYQVSFEPYLPLAASLEMIHTYSLIHDDLPCMDDDDLRRGVATCHKKYGEAIALLAGDALLTEAFYQVSTVAFPKPELTRTILGLLADAAGKMVYGQQQDLYYENKYADLSALEDTHDHKTGAMLSVPLVMAAAIASPKDMNMMAKIGHEIGRAFQIQDDILDVTGDESKLGKRTGMDEKQHKSTYASLLGIDAAESIAQYCYDEALRDVYSLKINPELLADLIRNLVKRDV